MTVCLFLADEWWWPGTVVGVNRNAMYDVNYDDGETEHRKPLSRLRPLAQKVEGS
tara:strand:+ start:130 stop:294 length:165 start_codon:yes stop_codon:yes gene_type:complete